jgi:flagellar biosynthetic protein FliR
MLATPLIFTNMLIMTVLGIIARTVPQLNVIMVSFAVNIGLGLLVFAATSDEFFNVAFKLYTDKLGEWFQFII